MDLKDLTPEKRALLFYNIYPHDNETMRQVCEIFVKIVYDAVLEERESNARMADSAGAVEAARQIRART